MTEVTRLIDGGDGGKGLSLGKVTFDPAVGTVRMTFRVTSIRSMDTVAMTEPCRLSRNGPIAACLCVTMDIDA